MQHEHDTEEEEQQEQGQEPINIAKIIWDNITGANEQMRQNPLILTPSVNAWDDPESDFTPGNVWDLGKGREADRSMLSEHFTHVEKHEYVENYCQSLINRWRYRVEPMWAIEVCVKCPAEMGLHEARVWWDEECWYACIEIGCQHLEPMLEWLCVHELCELRRWRSTGHMMEILDMLVDGSDKERLVRGFHIARNQEVEIEVYDLLGHRRPFHEREHE